MRILIANDLYGPSSAAGIAVAQARCLQARGHEVTFLGTVQQKEDARAFVEPSGVAVRLAHVPAYPLRFRSWVSLWNPPALRAVDAALDAARPDVVHFHNVHIYLSYRATQRARARGVPVLFTVHDVMPFCFQKMFCFVGEGLAPSDPPISFKAPMPRCIPCARLRYNPLRNPFIRWHLRRHVSRVLAVSPEMKRALDENAIGNVEALANGIDVAPKEDAAAVAAFRERFGLGGRKVVLYGGRLDHRKGAEHLIRALAKVHERVPAATLLVVGSGNDGYERTMLDLAGKLGLDGAVVTTGWLDQAAMGVAYAASDVICTPSLIFESFGLINAEGMLRGKPAVTSYFGGPKDVVEHGVSGFHVNPLHIDDLADKLGRLLGDDALRATMGAAARERVLTQFRLETQTARLEAIYRDVLRDGSAT